MRVSTAARTTNRRLVLAGMVVAMLLAAIEGTIVATAMPSIAARLGGFALYGWVFSSYLLMQAVTTPVFGKISDVYGRKPVLVGGMVVFLVGSALCGLADSMGALVAFRFLQGAGAGAVLPMTATLAGDLYTIEERARVQGYLATVWGVSSIVGPLAGGLIVENADWRWIFWLNVPVGVVALLLISRYLHEEVRHTAGRVDYAGAGLLLAGLSALMLALTQAAAWPGGATLALLSLSAAALVAFLRRERRAADPMMHLDLWRNDVIRLGNLTILVAGLAMIGLITFLPTFVQGVLGRTALVAGFTLSAMSIGWPLASVTAGRLFVRLGVRRIVRAGGAAVAAGSLWVALLVDFGPVAAGVGAFLMGVGLGLLNTTFIVAIQTSVPWSQRGVATASNMLMRNLGNALGAALFGGVLNLSMGRFAERRGLDGAEAVERIRDLVGEAPPAGAPLPDPASLAVLQEGLSASLHLVFWTVALFGVVILLLSARVPDLAAGSPAPAARRGPQRA